MWEDVEREINILKKLEHKNIIKVFEILEHEASGKVYIVMEYADKGEFLRWDEKKQVFNYADETKRGDYKYLKSIM